MFDEWSSLEVLIIYDEKIEGEFKGFIKQTRLPETKKRLYDVFDLDELIDGIKAKTVLNNFKNY